MDITKISTLDRSDPIYSFLSVAWTIVADVDLESEVLRWMGEPRFTVWTLIRALKLRKYGAILSYKGQDIINKNQEVRKVSRNDKYYIKLVRGTKSWDEFKEQEGGGIEETKHVEDGGEESKDRMDLLSEVPADWQTIESKDLIYNSYIASFTYFCLNNTPFVGRNLHNAPLSKIDDGYNDLVVSNPIH